MALRDSVRSGWAPPGSRSIVPLHSPSGAGAVSLAPPAVSTSWSFSRGYSGSLTSDACAHIKPPCFTFASRFFCSNSAFSFAALPSPPPFHSSGPSIPPSARPDEHGDDRDAAHNKESWPR